MNVTHKTSRILGFAFLLQFVTSFSSAIFLNSAWSIPGDIRETMLKMAAQPLLVRGNILLDILTAVGVIFLGAILFITLRKQNEKIALTALSFYILEGTLLAVSRMEAFQLLRISQEYATTGQPAYLLSMGLVTYEAMNFIGNTLHMWAFCLGGILFYFLLYKSGIVPRAMSLWGLIATLPMLIGTLTQIFGYTIPFIFYLPYVPFELVIAIWILLKGIRE